MLYSIGVMNKPNEHKNDIECPEEKKKRLSLKNKLGQLVAPAQDEQCLTKNAAAYEKAKRHRKIRKTIIFAAIAAVIATTYGLAFLFTSILPEHNAMARFFQIHILGQHDFYSPNRLLRSTLIIFTGFVIITIVHFIIRLAARGDSKRKKTIVSLIASLTKYIGYIVVLIILFEVWHVNQAVLAAAIAALGIAIGFGAQGLVGDLLTGLFLIFEDNLQVGDIITIDGFRGEIEEVGIRTTRLTSIGGDVMVINNSRFVKFVNMSMHRSFAVCDLNIGYGENIQKVEELVLGHLEKIADKFAAITDGPFYKGVVEFNERGVMIRIVAKVSEIERMQLIRDLNREFKLLFDENGIKLAVPKIELIDRK